MKLTKQKLKQVIEEELKKETMEFPAASGASSEAETATVELTLRELETLEKDHRAKRPGRRHSDLIIMGKLDAAIDKLDPTRDARVRAKAAGYYDEEGKYHPPGVDPSLKTSAKRFAPSKHSPEDVAQAQRSHRSKKKIPGKVEYGYE